VSVRGIAAPRRRRVQAAYARAAPHGFAQMEWFGPAVSFGQSGQGGVARVGKL